MNKRMLSRVRGVLSKFARKYMIPVGLAVVCLAPNCVYAFSTETNDWQNVQIYGGGMITGVTFSKAEKDIIYARTDMGGVYRWEPDTKSWKPLTDWVGPDDWSNLGCECIATDPTDANRVYTLMGEYTNSWTDIKGAIFCSADKGETWEVVKLPFKCGSNMQGRLMGEKLVVDPNKPSRLWLASRENGLWKSEDYGHTWDQVKSFPTVGAFKFDKGTGSEGFLGLTLIEIDESSATGSEGSQTIYVGASDQDHGLYKTTDGGKTWEALPNEPRGLVVDKKTGKTAVKEGVTLLPYQSYLTKEGMLYVTYCTEAGPYNPGSGDLWKFNTKTEEWSLISPKSSATAPDDPWYGYHGLAVDPQNENSITVMCQSWWPDAFMYRSTDGGATWKNVWEWTSYPDRSLSYNIDVSECPWLDWGSTHGPNSNAEASPKFGWNVGAIAIDPFDSDRMLYGTGATLYGTDNFTNWDKGEKFDIKVMAKGIEETVSNALVVLSGDGDGLVSSLFDINGFYHEDVTKVPSIMANVNKDKYETLNSSVALDYAELSPNIVVRVGARTAIDSYGSYMNGMMWSKDGGKTFAPIHSRVGNSEGKGKVALSADGSIVVWATPDEPVSWSKGGYNWTASTGIEAGARIASDRANSKLFYGYKDGKVYVSTDGAASFSSVTVEGLPSVTDMNIKAVKGYEGNVWLGTSKAGEASGFWYSEDKGQNFTKLDTVDAVLSFGFGKAKDENSYPAIYIVGKIESKDGFFRSDDKGQNWTRINDDDHQYGLVDPGCDVTGDPDVYGRVYIGTNGRGIVYADTGNGEETPSGTLSKTTATFDKKEDLQKDITIEITENGNPFSSLKVGDTTLARGVDYTKVGNTITLNKTYLATQKEGVLKVLFDFETGNDAALTITISRTTNQSSLVETSGTFDLAYSLPFTVQMNLNGNTLTAVKQGENELVKGTDYMVSDEAMTLSKDYLLTLEKGIHSFTFTFNEGNPVIFDLNVVNTQEKNAVVTPLEATFDKKSDQQIDLSFDVTLNGNTLTAIKMNDTLLEEGKDYQVLDQKITIFKDFLKTYEVGTYSLNFTFSTGEAQKAQVKVVDTTPIIVPEGGLELTLSSSGSPITNSIANSFKLQVIDENTYDLSKVAIRYYFTAEDNSLNQQVWIDNAAIQYSYAPYYVSINDNTTYAIVKMNEAGDAAGRYLEITFTGNELLDASAKLEVATRLANENWLSFDQSNDYSYKDASKVAVFYDGTLVSGSMPN